MYIVHSPFAPQAALCFMRLGRVRYETIIDSFGLLQQPVCFPV
ncbi:hypothetical protein NEISICOT_00209 [Neisseria sicca ATCC 29256]|uniref:Uncharacterized protein n=2 Tax=Neisseria TaxID=482 RepID=D2ZT42_NEIM2|nr:hypothetical protein NEISICOT_00209 [Neisseria sicca ATCC 29256]EFC89974.1 hypothetical protein NEIMUCOT_03774 [Neisseria mucosa ATCC 25996]